nr:adenylate/guanylate cyclase domain-containing protein [Roseospira goensis]
MYLAARDTQVAAEVEAVTLDARFRLRGPISPGGDVVLALVDDRTLEALGTASLPREELGAALHRLDAAGVRAVALNLFLGGQAAGSGGSGGAGGAAADAESLAQTLAALRGPVAVPFGVLFGAPGGAPAPSAAPAGLEAHAYRIVLRPTGDAGGPGAVVEAVQSPEAAILAAADAAGHNMLILDADGTLRHHDPVVVHADTAYPSLAIQATRLALGVAPEALAVRWGEAVRLGPVTVPVDRRTRIAINHYGPGGTLPAVSLIDVIEGRVPAAALRDRVVMIGGSAAGFGARFPSPYAETLTAAEHVGTMIDNILSDRVLRRGTAALTLDAAAVGTAVVVVGAAALSLPYGVAAALAVALVAAWGGVAVWALVAAHLWLNVAFPAAAVAAVFVPCALHRRAREQRRRWLMERQRRNLSRYFSPSVVDALANRDRPFAGDRMIDAAVLFVDMRDSTRICDGLDPTQAMDLLRGFHRVVERHVFDNNGVLDRFMGDGAMASFGPPEPTPAFALDAVRAARGLAAAVAEWSAGREAEGAVPIRIGVGVHCGRVLMGELGGDRQFAFTLSGETVAIASRLESLTKEVGAVVVVSDDLLRAARAVAADAEPALEGYRPLGARTIRGRAAPLDLWAWPDAGDPHKNQ